MNAATNAHDAPAETENPAPAPEKLPSRFSILMTRFQDWLAARQFRPVPTIIALSCVVVLLGLGSWQMQRLHWKNTLLRNAVEDFKQAPQDLRVTRPLGNDGWNVLHYKPVIIQGRWLTPFHPIKLAPRTLDGQSGYQLMIPLVLDDNQIVMINRGFVPDSVNILPPEKSDALIRGVAYHPEETKPPFMPENVPSREVWVWPDLLAMSHDIGRKQIASVIIYEDRVENKDGFPRGGQLPLPSNNSHRQYAVTWFALAFALIGVWLMASNPKPAVENTDLNAEGKELDPVAKRGMYPEATD